MLDLHHRRLGVNPPLTAALEFEMLHGIGDIDIPALDPGFRQGAVQQLPRRPDERPPGDVFLIARLLADKGESGTRLPFSQNRLRGTRNQWRCGRNELVKLA
jgi:hypothetical protein